MSDGVAVVEQKKYRGRPKGATSLIQVTLADLMKDLKPEDIVTVGRVWLEKRKAVPAAVTETATVEAVAATNVVDATAPNAVESAPVEGLVTVITDPQ